MVAVVAASAPLVALAIDTVALSLSAMMLVARTVALNVMRPVVGAVRVMATVSLPSTKASLSTGIEMVAVVAPARIVTVPDKAV